MNDNNLDDLFRDGLRDSGLEFKDAYWAEMEDKLDASKASYLKKEMILLLFVFALQAVLFLYPSGETAVNKESQTGYTKDQMVLDLHDGERKDLKGGDSTNANQPVKPADGELVSSDIILPRNGSLPFVPASVPAVHMPLQNSVDLNSDRPGHLQEFKWMRGIEPEFIGGYEQMRAEWQNMKSPGMHSKNLALFLEPYATYGSYAVNIGAAALPPQKKYEDHKKAVGAGLDLRIQYRKLSFTTGLGFSRYSGSAAYITENPQFDYDSSLVVVNWDYDRTATGNRVVLVKWQQDSIQTGTDTTVCQDCVFSFDYLSIPFRLDYEIPLYGFRLYSGIGLNIQYLLRTQGFYSALDETAPLPASSLMSRSFLSGFFDFGLRGQIVYPLSYTVAYRYSTGLSSMIKTYSEVSISHSVRFGLSLSL